MQNLTTLFLLGLSVGLSNFAASIAIGLSGVNKALRLRIALVFGGFESGMPLIGLLIGSKISGALGAHANLIGGTLLILTGLHAIVSSYRGKDDKEVQIASRGTARLLIAGLALSIDNLIIGFSLGAHQKEPLLLSALVIGSISVALAMLGLELGSRLGKKTEKYSEVFGGIILIGVGLFVL